MYQWLPQQQYRTFFIVMGIVVLAFVLRSFLCFVVGYWGHTFGIRVEADIRRDLFRHMQELSFDFYDQQPHRPADEPPDQRSLFELTELAHHGPEDSVHLRSRPSVGASLIVMLAHPVAAGAGGESHASRIFMVVAMYAALPPDDAPPPWRGPSRKRATSTPRSRPASPASAPRKAFANEAKRRPRSSTAPTRYSRAAKRGFHKGDGPVLRRHGASPSASCPLWSSPWAAGSIIQGSMDYCRS